MLQKSFLQPVDPCRRDLTQGAKANKSGQTAEDTIYCIFKERGYQVRRQVELLRNIYGYPCRVDFWIDGLPDFPNGLIIESKWQSASGSVDEKYPYLVLNIQQCYPCPAIVMADGGGARDGSLEWLRRQVDGEKLVAVFSFVELMNWVIDRY